MFSIKNIILQYCFINFRSARVNVKFCFQRISPNDRQILPFLEHEIPASVLQSFSHTILPMANSAGWSKISLQLMITIQTVTSNVQFPLSVSRHLLTRQGDIRLPLTPSVTPHSNYVIMVSDWNCLKYFLRVFFTVIIRCTEIFWLPCTFRRNFISF
jgi:hypothetical protein